MGEVINLNKQRKARAKAEQQAAAAANRVKFGRTKTEKAQDGAERGKISKILDLAKRDE